MRAFRLPLMFAAACGLMACGAFAGGAAAVANEEAQAEAAPPQTDAEAEAPSDAEGAGDASASKEAAPRRASAAVIKISGALPETAGAAGLFGEMQTSLESILRRLDQAARDEQVKAVVLQIRNPAIGRGKVDELRAAIHRLREAGKWVVADLEAAMTADYLIAAACDEVLLPPSGVFLLPGVRAEVTFYKNLLGKLGIEADMMQVGDCKGAAEPFTRTKMSDAFRRQFETVIDDVYRQIVETIAADRKLEVACVEEAIDRGLLTPEAALKAGLVDRLAYADALPESLAARLEVDEVRLIDKYGAKQVDTDFSGMTGLLRLLDLMTGGKAERRARGKKIAVVYATGPIMSGESGSDLFFGEMMGSDTIVAALRTAAEDKEVAAIVLRVDSPGGSALASDLIWREVRRIRSESGKPVIGSMGDVAASGGYYITMSCDRVFAGAGTITGSIGVVGGKLAMRGLYEKIGVNTEVISRGRNAGIFSSEALFSDSEREAWRAMLDDVYRQFTEKAAEGRGMQADELAPLAGGRIWTGRQAQQRGLVDEVGTLHDAIAAAKAAAGIAADERVETMTLPKPRSLFEQLFSAEAQMHSAAAALLPEALQPLRRAEGLRRLFAEPAVTIMPFRLEIK